MRAWIEVDLGQIKRNVAVYTAGLPEGTDIMAVVKADAYGHGAPAVAGAMREAGVRRFAVATLGEGVVLRNAGVTGEILILGYTPPQESSALETYRLTQTLLSAEHAETMCSSPFHFPCQFAVDTGMRRAGLAAADPETPAVIRRYAHRLTGIYTHLCAAERRDAEAVAFTRGQIIAFHAVLDRVRDLHLPAHCLNSAGGLFYPAAGGLVRLGIMWCGLSPGGDCPCPPGIRPVLSLKSRVARVARLLPGDTVGYGMAERVSRPTLVGTVPLGYADGYDRCLSLGRGYAAVLGHPAPTLGRVCMDCLTLDLTDVPGAVPGVEVTLLGPPPAPGAAELARLCDTVPHEIFTRLGTRVPRIYQYS